MYACDLAPPPFTTTTTNSFILVRCSVYFFPGKLVFRREVNSKDYFVRLSVCMPDMYVLEHFFHI